MTAIAREEIRVGEMVIRFLLEGEASAASVAVFEFEVPAGARIAAAHSHDGYDETICGLDGMLTWTLEGVAIDVGPAARPSFGMRRPFGTTTTWTRETVRKLRSPQETHEPSAQGAPGRSCPPAPRPDRASPLALPVSCGAASPCSWTNGCILQR